MKSNNLNEKEIWKKRTMIEITIGWLYFRSVFINSNFGRSVRSGRMGRVVLPRYIFLIFGHGWLCSNDWLTISSPYMCFCVMTRARQLVVPWKIEEKKRINWSSRHCVSKCVLFSNISNTFLHQHIDFDWSEIPRRATLYIHVVQQWMSPARQF